MSSRSNYLKKFIIFKKGYSNMKELKSKGHGKLEVKGNNLNVSLNIKGAEANNFYNLDLIKGRKAYTLGKIYTKEDKTAQRDINLNYREVEKQGFPLEEVDGIILSRGSKVLFGESLKLRDKALKSYIESLEEEVTPLVKEEPTREEAAIDEDKSQTIEDKISIEYLEDIDPLEQVEARDEKEARDEINLESFPEEEQLPEVEEEDFQEIGNTGYTQEISEEEKEEEEEERIDEEEGVGPVDQTEQIDQTENERATQLSPKTEDMFSEKAYEEIMEEIFNIPELGYDKQEHLDDQAVANKNKIQADQVSQYVKNILNFFPPSEPFTMALKGYDWWKIDTTEVDGDKSFLPYFSYIIGGNKKSDRFDQGRDPRELLNRYGHYLFGLYNEGERVKFYMYGLPGTFSLDDYPRGGSAGFNTWFEGVEVAGYWVIYIEPETGKILYPINPMIPKA